MHSSFPRAIALSTLTTAFVGLGATSLLPACGDANTAEAGGGAGGERGPGNGGGGDSPTVPRDTPPPITANAVSALVAAQNTFSIDLYRTVASSTEGRFFFSPLSVHQALSMAYAGAAGATQSAMRDVLHAGADDAAYHDAQNAVAQAVTAPPAELPADAIAPVVRLANTLFVQQNYPLLPTFTDRLGASYGAAAQAVDFAGDTEGARGTINAWVAEHTEDHIPELLKPGMISEMTRLTLVNAVYFLGQWATAFEPAATFEETFRGADGDEPAPFMHGTFDLAATSNETYDAVALPYAGGELHMLAIAPKGEGSLAAFEAEFDGDALAGVDGALTVERTSVAVPKFEMRSPLMLKAPLGALGMGPAFTEADFSGITGARDLSISDVVHEAWVRVDESGTEAAAATAVVFDAGAAPEPVESRSVRLDRPFLALIRHVPTGAILFMARVDSVTAAP
jgi:serpin B